MNDPTGLRIDYSSKVGRISLGILFLWRNADENPQVASRQGLGEPEMHYCAGVSSKNRCDVWRLWQPTVLG